ncbi:MAG: Fe2+-dependent dioxygenase [Ideonella sp.]|nr:Fe2+-dependent dioxygenase [Ideonella sp.]
MIVCIGQVLTGEQIAQVNALLQKTPFEDGAATAGWAARGVKHNRQLPAGCAALRTIHDLVQTALLGNETFMSAALPKAMTPVLVSQSLPGMGYGNHIDNAVMGAPHVRTDLAFTLFLSAPDSFGGGELTIDEPQGEQTFKLAPGEMVLYPATTLHRVQPVTSGQRCVVAGWVQSLVRDPRVREMLFELDAVRRALFAHDGLSTEFDLLQKTYSNLLRLHAET